MNKLTLLLVAAGLAAVACDGPGPVGPAAPSAGGDGSPTIPPAAQRERSDALDVMTWNVYVGARIEDLLQVQDPAQIPLEVAKIFGAVQATDFAERARAIADQIRERRPQVVGLQEITLFRLQSPGDFLAGNPVPATEPVLDYLEILLDALQAEGLEYVAAASSPNFDIELPMVDLSTGGLDDIRLTDFDVILVRSDVEWFNPRNGNYAAVLPIPLAGMTIFKQSGWASVDVRHRGSRFRILNTHLEPADLAPGVVDPSLAALQAAQAAELLGLVGEAASPVIMLGDFNSDPDGSTTATYQTVLDAGFLDVWNIGRARGEGFTANQDPGLLNPVSELFHRIDFVFFRDRFTRRTGRFRGSVHVERVGAKPEDRTESGLWPSDHAGVAAALRIRRAGRGERCRKSGDGGASERRKRGGSCGDR